MTYTIEFQPKTRRAFDKLPRQLQKRLTPRIDALANDPRPRGVLKLKGYENQWRIRVGDYRIVYEIYDNVVLVLIVAVPHRSQAYDRP